MELCYKHDKARLLIYYPLISCYVNVVMKKNFIEKKLAARYVGVKKCVYLSPYIIIHAIYFTPEEINDMKCDTKPPHLSPPYMRTEWYFPPVPCTPPVDQS